MNIDDLDLSTVEKRRKVFQAWLQAYGSDPELLSWALNEIKKRCKELVQEERKEPLPVQSILGVIGCAYEAVIGFPAGEDEMMITTSQLLPDVVMRELERSAAFHSGIHKVVFKVNTGMKKISSVG